MRQPVHDLGLVIRAWGAATAALAARIAVVLAGAILAGAVLAGSGTTPQSLAATLRRCSGAVVGTALKHPQTGRIERSRAVAYVEARRS